MKKPTEQVSKSRRRFVRDAGISSGVAAVSAAAPVAAFAGAADDETMQDKPAQGYRLSKHILAYYKSVAD